MAKLLQGLFGPISGKAGNMVFFTRNGKCYVRSLPRPANKPATAKQVEQRSKFGMAVRFASPFKSMVRETLRSRKPELTGMNILIKDILHHSLAGEYPDQRIDYSKVRLCRGYIPGVYHPEIRLAATGKLKLDWPADPGMNALSSDQLIVAVYRESLNQCWYDLRTGVSRCQGTCTVSIPRSFSSRETHVWIAFRSAERALYSDSQYLGTLFNKSNR